MSPQFDSTSPTWPQGVDPVVLCDLDGVVWLAHQPIPGSPEAIAQLRAAGVRVLFVTNNSAARTAEQEQALADIGVPAVGDVLTSAHAAARLVDAGERVLVCGGPGIHEALDGRGAEALAVQQWRGRHAPAVNAVMVGFHRDFDYETMRLAAQAIRRGARLIGTNDDATYPTPEGPIPGGGSILAAVATASGSTPIIAGKPYPPMADLVRSVVGDQAATTAVMVGDRPSTDGLFASMLQCRFALVHSGVTDEDDAVDVASRWRVANLAAVADALVGSAR